MPPVSKRNFLPHSSPHSRTRCKTRDNPLKGKAADFTSSAIQVYGLGLILLPGLVQASDWNCQRNEKSQEWVCASRKADQAPAPRPSANPAKTPELPVPAAAESAPRLQPVAPEHPHAVSRSVPSEPAKPAADTPLNATAPVARLPQAPLPQTVMEDDEDDDDDGERSANPVQSVPEQPIPAPRRHVVEKGTPEMPPIAPAGQPDPKPSPRPRLDAAAAQVSAATAAAAPTAGSPRAGWRCRAVKGGDKNWDCASSAPEATNQTADTATPSSGKSGWASAGTIVSQDELRFKAMANSLAVNPWNAVCSGQRNKRPMQEFVLSPEERLARERSPVNIYSNYAETKDNEVSTFTGETEMIRADQKLWADFVSHNASANTVNARGGVFYQEQGLALSSDSAFLDMDNDHHVFRNTQFIIESIPARGTSRLTHFEGEDISRYENFSYTACPPGNQDWMLHAGKVKIDKSTGRGVARNAWFEFKGIPLFYSPYLSFPTDDRRQSGFLNPSFGTTKVGGLDIMVPYYFNLAPNYDMTFTPRMLTRRGILLRDELQYMTHYGQGRVLAEFLPDDAIRNEGRGQASWLNDSQLGENFRAHVDANYVSDSRYLNELGNPLNIVNYRYIRSNAYANYSGEHYNARVVADYFQTIDPTILTSDRPYYHLPQLVLNYGHALGKTGVNFDSMIDVANFAHDDETKVIGQRLNIKPRISYPMQTAEGFVTPSLSLQHTQYLLENQAPGMSNDMSRTIPIASVDSGLFFEREFAMNKKPWVQTLEPRLYYLYVPYTNQNDLPVFDTTEYDFTFYQLFRDNRFTNADRLSDANQVTTALTSRFIDETSGLEWLRTSVGKVFYFDSPQVSLTRDIPPAQVKENIITDIYSRFTQNWSFRTSGQWNPAHERIDRGQLALQFDDRNNNLLNLAYRFRRHQNQNTNSLNLTDVSFRVPIVRDWHLIGRWQYSLLDDRTLESFLGFERETCCWRFTLLGRHYMNGIANSMTGNNTANTGIFMQLELKGLARLGDQIDQFLERSIGGYRYEDE